MENYNISNDSSNFVVISEYIPDVLLDIRYYSTFNFVGERIDGYKLPIAIISKSAAEKLKKVSDYFKEKGYLLKIFDAYRPHKAVMHFVRWAKDIDNQKMKDYFYPDVDKTKLFELGYIAEKSTHSRGSTVDLTLFDIKTGKDLDMGGTFDFFGDISHSDYTKLTKEQLDNRKMLHEVMIANGFKPLEEEWWHFTLVDEPYKDTYFNFDINTL